MPPAPLSPEALGHAVGRSIDLRRSSSRVCREVGLNALVLAVRIPRICKLKIRAMLSLTRMA